MFYYLGKFGQAVLWPSLPDRVTKKKENCRSLWPDTYMHPNISEIGTKERENRDIQTFLNFLYIIIDKF